MARVLSGKRPLRHWRLGSGRSCMYPTFQGNSLGWGLGEGLGVSHVLGCTLPRREQIKNGGDVLPFLPPNPENPHRRSPAPA